MNGSTLKVMFMTIVVTFCAILIIAATLLLFGRISSDIFEKIVDKLGIITLFSMIAQSFLHTDANKNGIPDAQETIKPKGKENEEIIPSPASVVPNADPNK